MRKDIVFTWIRKSKLSTLMRLLHFIGFVLCLYFDEGYSAKLMKARLTKCG